MKNDLIIESFEHFTEDMDKKLKNNFLHMDRWAYYNILVSKYPWDHRPMKYNKKDVYVYSFEELYDQMCTLFYQIEDGDASKMYEIILLKNFINYKMSKEVA